MTSGDVLAVLYPILTLCGTVWAALVVCALVFRERAERARVIATERTVWSIVIGALAFVMMLVMVNIQHPVIRILGWVLTAGTLGLALLGSAGLSLLVAERIQEQRTSTSRFAAIMQGAGLLVGMGMIPGLGQLVLMPLLLTTSVGAGLRAAFWPIKEPAVAAPAQSIYSE